MRINPVYNPVFTSRNRDIRKADDIQRKTRAAVPFFSPRYAKIYYPCCSNSDFGKLISADRAEKLDIIRKERYVADEKFSSLIQQVISDTDREHLANCGEAALITMSALIANGFPDSHRCAVYLNNAIFDKQTGRQCFSENYDLDHACVISTMDKYFNSQKPYVVLDSWHGFADSISGAKGKYLQLFKKEELEEYKKATMQAFEEKTKTWFNPDDYEIKQSIDFDIINSPTKEEDKSIKKMVRQQYQQLIFNNDEKPKD